MPRITKVMYSITKQVQRYEPVEVEVHVERGENEKDVTDEELCTYARGCAERMIVEAIERGQRGPVVADNFVRRPELPSNVFTHPLEDSEL